MCYKKKEPFLYLVQVIYIMMQLLPFLRLLEQKHFEIHHAFGPNSLMQLVSASSRTSPARHIGELMGTSLQSEQMMFYSGVAKTKKLGPYMESKVPFDYLPASFLGSSATHRMRSKPGKGLSQFQEKNSADLDNHMKCDLENIGKQILYLFHMLKHFVKERVIGLLIMRPPAPS